MAPSVEQLAQDVKLARELEQHAISKLREARLEVSKRTFDREEAVNRLDKAVARLTGSSR